MTGHTPRKALGQHFLHRKDVIEQIVRYFNPQADDAVVEIGPGLGALTYDLLPLVKTLHVIELDDKLADALQKQTARYTNLHVHHADALKTNLLGLDAGAEMRLIGNLPYNISTPLLFHFLKQRACIRDMCFMLQKEVGQRIQAAPGNKQYGRLSVMIQQCCEVNLLIHVDKSAFTPPPKIDSVVINLTPYRNPPHPVSDPEAFAAVVRAAFSQRRKTLRNALKPLIPAHRIDELGINPGLRPEQLSVEAYANLSQLL